MELFTWCYLRYEEIGGGVRFSIVENWEIVNMTNKKLWVAVLDKKDSTMLGTGWAAVDPYQSNNITKI